MTCGRRKQGLFQQHAEVKLPRKSEKCFRWLMQMQMFRFNTGLSLTFPRWQTIWSPATDYFAVHLLCRQSLRYAASYLGLNCCSKVEQNNGGGEGNLNLAEDMK